MTVNTIDITSGPYAGNDIADTFDYTFRIEDKSQIAVFETDDTGVQVELTVDTDYTVAGLGVDNGGTITRVAGALPTGYEWYIRSDYKQTQLTAFESQGGFFPDVHERAMDKLTFLSQQQEDKIARSVRFSDSYTGTLNILLPAPDAGKALLWNDNEDGLINSDENINGITDAVAASTAAAAASETNAAASETNAAASEANAATSANQAANSAASVPVAFTGQLPFVKTNGAADNILLIEATPGDFELPFFKTNGDPSNISIIGI